MSSSAFERELIHRAFELKGWFAAHDRAVLAGLMLSCIPILPITVAGLLLTLFNYQLWKSHKLDVGEIRLIRFALLVGLMNSAVGVAFLVYVMSIASGFAWHSIITYPLGALQAIAERIGLLDWTFRGNRISI